MKILVVDDEKLMVKGLKFNLEHEGYEVESCYDGESAVRLARATSFDLVLLDLMMPGLDGLEACRRIREFSSVPIIMLTARAEDTEKLIGFEYGADDYVTKPFNIMELKARIRVILRRTGAQKQQQERRIQVDGIELDADRRSVVAHGKPVELTAKEFDIAELLMSNPGRVYTRESLLNIVWGYEFPGDIRTVDVHVRRLREKLERDPARPEVFLTKWGVGYYCKT